MKLTDKQKLQIADRAINTDAGPLEFAISELERPEYEAAILSAQAEKWNITDEELGKAICLSFHKSKIDWPTAFADDWVATGRHVKTLLCPLNEQEIIERTVESLVNEVGRLIESEAPQYFSDHNPTCAGECFANKIKVALRSVAKQPKAKEWCSHIKWCHSVDLGDYWGYHLPAGGGIVLVSDDCQSCLCGAARPKEEV